MKWPMNENQWNFRPTISCETTVVVRQKVEDYQTDMTKTQLSIFLYF